MIATNLQSPILAGGIRSVNFFNGRLLSGEDLSQDWEANREARRRLGQAIGDGVAYGLEVSETAGGSPLTSTITVTKGLAVNRQGQTLVLTEDTNVSLVRPASGSPAVATTFNECEPTQLGVYVAGAGVYLLSIASATGSEGRAPVSGLGNIAATCNTRYTIEGVQFRLISLSSALNSELTDLDHLRNRVAYKCFGAYDSSLQAFIANPFGPQVESYGLLDDLRPNCLTNCDVPLAVIYWTAAGIEFIDMWSVRRRIIKPAADEDWIPLLSDRRVSEGEALFLQFQEQIGEMRADGTNLNSIVATDRFDFLPPMGILPLSGVKGSVGFDYLGFFSSNTYRHPVYIEGARVESLLHESFSYPPIDLNSKEMLWLYRVRENFQAIDNSNLNPPQAYLIFASGHTPFRGEAHFDLNYWNYSNYV